jgi:autotransporter-associated beta strand protein
VTNNAPTTISAVTFELGTSAFRNRINGTADQPLTLQSANGLSTITVTGTGTGHANIEVPGGVTLANDVVLDVQNAAAGNAEYGALRLQGNWSGAGRLIKRGPGMAGITGAGKSFSGDIVVEQGVLTFSEPAITGNNVSSYTVQSGGQLRLSSAGNPRNYLFQGPLSLAGSGRTGVPEDENLGVLGALRLETGSTGSTAVLGNTVHLAASADIHVPAGNTVRLDGSLTTSTNTNILAKSGGGTLTLTATSSAFTGGLDVNRGTLYLDGAVLANTAGTLALGSQTTLTGSGSWGGELHVQSGATLAADLGAAPASAPLRASAVNVSGPSVVSLSMPSNAVSGMYPLVATAAGITGASNLALSLASSNFPYASLAVSNNTLYAVLSSNAHNFRQWAGDVPWSGDSDGNGHIALAEFALGASAPGAPFAAPMMGWTNQGGTNYLTLRATVRTNALGLSVVGQSAAALASGNPWSSEGVEMISATSDLSSGFEERVYRTPADGERKFLRLSIELEEQ